MPSARHGMEVTASIIRYSVLSLPYWLLYCLFGIVAENVQPSTFQTKLALTIMDKGCRRWIQYSGSTRTTFYTPLRQCFTWLHVIRVKSNYLAQSTIDIYKLRVKSKTIVQRENTENLCMWHRCGIQCALWDDFQVSFLMVWLSRSVENKHSYINAIKLQIKKYM